MNTTLEQAIEVVRSLPMEEKKRLREWLEKEEREKIKSKEREDLQQQEERFQRSMAWLKTNRTKYIGEWVALDGENLISHGKDVLQVRAEAKTAGVDVPLIERITENDTLPFGGW